MNEMFVLEVEDDPFLEKPKREKCWGLGISGVNSPEDICKNNEINGNETKINLLGLIKG